MASRTAEIIAEIIALLREPDRNVESIEPEVVEPAAADQEQQPTFDVFATIGVWPAVADDDRHDGRYDGLATEISVRRAINHLRQLDRLGRPVWGNKKENIESLSSVRDAIAGLQAALAAMPDAALALPFTFEENGTAEYIPTEQVQQRMMVRVKQLTGMLAFYRARCAVLLADPPGKHGSAGFRQEWAACAARDLLTNHFKRPTLNPTGAFLEVAALLYEAMTGEELADLSRACKVALSQGTTFLGRKTDRKSIFPS
jgi:hypothetical protein